VRHILFAGLATLVVMAAGPAAAAPHAGPATRIAVGGGLSIAVPAGWTACDAPTRALLGGKEASGALGKKFCADFDSKGGAKAVLDPSPADSLAVSMAFTPNQPFPEEFYNSATPDKLHTLGDDECANTFGAEAASATCVFTVQTVAGHHALSGIMRPTSSGTGADSIRLVTVGAHGGSVILIFFGSHIAKDPRIEAILDSVTVE
jgi:hypothetical protein